MRRLSPLCKVSRHPRHHRCHGRRKMPGRGRRFPEALKNVHQKACDTPSCASRPFANAASCRNFPSVSQTAEVLRGFLQKELVPRGGDQGEGNICGRTRGAALKQEAKKLAARPSEVRPRKDHRGVDLISDARRSIFPDPIRHWDVFACRIGARHLITRGYKSLN